jgi:hypothetical protein
MVPTGARNAAPMAGIATFTIVRSSTVMIVPRMTTTARVSMSRLRPSARAPAVDAAVLVDAIVSSRR